jgi:hypothetical protein
MSGIVAGYRMGDELDKLGPQSSNRVCRIMTALIGQGITID